MKHGERRTILAGSSGFAPGRAKSRAPNRTVLRDYGGRCFWVLLIVAASLAGGASLPAVEAASEVPVEARRTPPPLPSKLDVYNKSYDLTTLENPVRAEVLEQRKTDPAKARNTHALAVRAGRDVYYKNCFHCHGDLLDGQGVFAKGFNPPPINFSDPKSIAQLSEAYLFWRVTTGGPGLPKEAAPWNSAMPVGHEILSEKEVWNVITFLYDRTGQVPRMRDKDAAAAMLALQAEITAKRKNMKSMELYLFRCAVCHGEAGRGDGPAVPFLYPAPRDFSIGLFKYKTSSHKQQRPTDEDLFRTIKKGLNRTAMPAWGAVLSDDQIRSLIPVVKGFDTIGTWAPEEAPDSAFDEDGRYTGQPLSFPKKFPVENQVPFSKESVAAGVRHFRKNCTPCHGDEGRGNPAPEKKLKDDWGNRVWPRDQTKPWTWRVSNVPGNAKETIRNIYVRLSLGIPGTPMPSHVKGVSEQDRWHIANFLYTLRNNAVPPSESPVIRGVKAQGALPNSVDDKAWQAAPITTLVLQPNIIKGDRLFTPLNDAVSVRVLYDAESLAFLLEIADRTHSRPGDPDAEKIKDKKLKLYPDAIAIQFPKQDAFTTEPVVEKPLFSHGDRHHSTTIWYWRTESVEPKRLAASMIFDAAGVDEKLRPRHGDTGLTASGKWANGIWRVIMKRRRNSGNSGDVNFVEGEYIPISFANWDGSNGETGSKHTLSPWYWLLLLGAEQPLESFSHGVGKARGNVLPARSEQRKEGLDQNDTKQPTRSGGQ